MNGWAGTPSYFMMQTTSFAHLEAPPAPNNNCRQSSWRTSRWSSRSKGSTSTWHGFPSWTWKTSQSLRVLISFKKFRTRTWCIFIIFEQKPHVANFSLVLSFNFHLFFVTANALIPWCFFTKSTELGALEWCLSSKTAASGCGCVFFCKKRHDIPSSYCKFPKSKKAKNRYLYRKYSCGKINISEVISW